MSNQGQGAAILLSFQLELCENGPAQSQDATVLDSALPAIYQHRLAVEAADNQPIGMFPIELSEL